MKKNWYLLFVLALAGIGLGIVATANFMNRESVATISGAATSLKILSKCPGLLDENKKFDCYQTYLDDVVHKQGAEASLRELDRLSKGDGYVLSQCHPLVHGIGHEAFHHYGSVQNATKHGSEICWSGYFHGVMESYMAGFDDTKLMAMMPTICKPDPKKPYSFDYYNCLHGLGHGVTVRFENDIFKALPFCQVIPQDWERQSCYSGVFMQNIVVDNRNHKSVNLKPDDPIYPCNAVVEDQKQSCYLMVTSQVLKYTNYNYAQGFSWCGRADKNYLHTCYQSMGRDISGNFLLDRQKILSTCKAGGDGAEPDCIIGAVKNDVFNDRNELKANALCATVDHRLREPCVTAKDEAAATI